MNNNAINHNNHISYFAGDISKEEVSISLMEETIKKFGTIDVLINNATISQQSIASQSYEMSGAAAAATNTNASANASTNYQEEGQPSPYFTVEEYGITDT
jgi:NAD(P)-dependent dehydrogenase (short-subunit alcohol dehydrogenase family)